MGERKTKGRYALDEAEAVSDACARPPEEGEEVAPHSRNVPGRLGQVSPSLWSR